MCAPRLPPPGGLQRRARALEQPEQPAPGAAGGPQVPAVPRNPHVCRRGWKMRSAPCRGWTLFPSLPSACGCDSVPVRGLAAAGELLPAAHAAVLIAALRSPRSAASQDPGSHLSCTEHIPRTWPRPACSTHTAALLARNSPREMALDGCTDLYPSSTLPQHQQCKERCCWLVTARCSGHPACLHCRGTTASTGGSPATLTCSSSLPAAPAEAPAHGGPSA